MLYLASFVVALSYSSEIRDIKFTEFTQATALERFQTEKMCGNQFDLAGFLPMNGWHAALYILAWLRQFVFLPPVLITAVPMLVSTNGGDAQTIALSCVSILFFLDVDNYIYEYGLDESTREYLDENTRVELDDEKVALTSRIKMSFIVCLPFMIIRGHDLHDHSVTRGGTGYHAEVSDVYLHPRRFRDALEAAWRTFAPASSRHGRTLVDLPCGHGLLQLLESVLERVSYWRVAP